MLAVVDKEFPSKYPIRCHDWDLNESVDKLCMYNSCAL